MSQSPAGPSPFVHKSFSEMLAERVKLESDMISLENVPEEYHIYHQLLPAEHASKYVLANAETDEERKLLEEQSDIAALMAQLTQLATEDFFEDMVKLVGYDTARGR